MMPAPEDHTILLLPSSSVNHSEIELRRPTDRRIDEGGRRQERGH